MYTSINTQGVSSSSSSNHYHTHHHHQFLIKAAIIVGSGGLIFGYDIGVISGTLTKLKDVFHLNDFEIGFIVSILYAGSIIGSIIGGPLCDYMGRWKTIQLQNFIFILGALLTGLANSMALLSIGRFLVGIASAISGLADVPYLTEIAPAEYRGLISGQYEILVGAGIMLSFVLDLVFSNIENGWRIAFILPGIFAATQSLGMLLLPDSPKWLLSKGLLEESKIALMDIYGDFYFLRQFDSAFQIGVEEDIDDSLHFEKITSPVNAVGGVGGGVGATRSPTSVDGSASITSSPDKQLLQPPHSNNNKQSLKYTHSIDLQDLPPDIQDYFEAVKQQRLDQQEEGGRGYEVRGNYYDDDYPSPSTTRPRIFGVFGSNNRPFQFNKKKNTTTKTKSNKNHGNRHVNDDEMKSSLMSDHSIHHSYSTDAHNNSNRDGEEVMNPVTISSNHYEGQGGQSSLRKVSSTRSISVSSFSEFFNQESDVLHSYRYIIGMIILIQILSQITGANVIRNYAPTIFEESGVSEHMSLVYNAILGVIKLVFTIIAVVYVEHGGRRTFLLYGIAIVTLGMFFLAVMSLTSPTGNIQNPIVFLIGCGLVYAGFGIGYGPAPWILSSEMVPTTIRGRIMSLSLIASNIAQLVMNFIFLPMTDVITTTGSFTVFVCLNLITFVYVYLFLVETKEVLPPEILKKSLKRRQEACSTHGCNRCCLCWTSGGSDGIISGGASGGQGGGGGSSGGSGIDEKILPGDDTLYHSVTAYNLIDEDRHGHEHDGSSAAIEESDEVEVNFNTRNSPISTSPKVMNPLVGNI